jgi:putative transposase
MRRDSLLSHPGSCPADRVHLTPMESVFAALKVEHVHQCRFRTREEAKAAVFDYVEVFYNRQRLHSALGYLTPVEARARLEGIPMLAA